MCFLAICMSSMEKYLFRPSDLFFFFFGIEMHELFVYFEDLIPYQLHPVQIFSHIFRLFFILFMASFAMQKLLSLVRSHLLVFVFTSINLGDTAMIYIKECSSYVFL